MTGAAGRAAGGLGHNTLWRLPFPPGWRAKHRKASFRNPAVPWSAAVCSGHGAQVRHSVCSAEPCVDRNAATLPHSTFQTASLQREGPPRTTGIAQVLRCNVLLAWPGLPVRPGAGSALSGGREVRLHMQTQGRRIIKERLGNITMASGLKLRVRSSI
jgi:hypothetical protein